MNNEECINLYYFDKNEKLSAKQHCDMYLNIKKDILAIATHYPIDFVIAGTEVVNNLQQEKENLINYLKNKINKYNHEHIVADLYTQYDLNYAIKSAYQDILERVISGEYE